MRRHRILPWLAAVGAVCLASMSAGAQAQHPISCQGYVLQVNTRNNGEVWMNASAWLSTNGGWWRVCSVTDALNGVATTTCHVWLSLIATAVTNDQQINIWIDNTDPNLNCSNYPYAMTPSYIMLVNP